MNSTQQKTNRRHRAWYNSMGALFILLLLLFWPTAPLVGNALGQQVEQNPGLPPRPDPILLPARPKPRESFKGGHIELHIAPAVEIWTEVEWQGGDGQWHVAEGWRGYATTKGVVRWFVDERNLNTGPFRWQLYLYEEGDYLATSIPFMLPSINGERTVITVEAAALADFLP